MRYLKKSSFDELKLKKFASKFKEVELYLSRGNIDNLKIEKDKENVLVEQMKNLKKIYNTKIKAIHCPSSSYKTKGSGENSVNYMSWDDIINSIIIEKKNNDNLDLNVNLDLSNCNEYQKLVDICNFAMQIFDTYNEKDKAGETPEPVYIIMHTGSAKGCVDDEEGLISDILKKEIEKIEKIVVEDLIEKVLDENQVQKVCILFENITPFYNNDEKGEKVFGENNGFYHENFELAKKLNQLNPLKDNTENNQHYFGVLVDFCHILATKKLLSEKGDEQGIPNWCEGDENIPQYFNDEKIENDDKKLIKMFHLSNYKNDLHGQVFDDYNEKDTKILEEIKVILQEYDDIEENKINEILVTIEVDGEESNSENIDFSISEKKFNKVMLLISKIHTQLKGKINNDLYVFFDYLYYIYANDRISIENSSAEFDSTLYKIRDYIYENSKDKKILMYQLHNDEDSKSYENSAIKNIFDEDIDINLFQTKSYIYYMRFVNLALRLLKEENSIETDKVSKAMKFYMFQDSEEELIFDGLMGYFQVYWLPRKATLFHLYDGISEFAECVNDNNEFNFNSHILEPCRNHINGTKDCLKLLSTGKSFLYCMCKYFNPDSKTGKTILEIYPNVDINYAILEDENENKNKKQISLQELRLNTTADWLKEHNNWKISNYSIDFSSFFGERVGIASLDKLFRDNNKNIDNVKDTGKGISLTKVASIKDKEVVFLNKSSLKPIEFELTRIEFELTRIEFIILMLIYKKIILTKKDIIKFEDINNKEEMLKKYVTDYISENEKFLIEKIFGMINGMRIDELNGRNIGTSYSNFLNELGYEESEKHFIKSEEDFSYEQFSEVIELSIENIVKTMMGESVTKTVTTEAIAEAKLIKVDPSCGSGSLDNIAKILSYIDFEIDAYAEDGSSIDSSRRIEYKPYKGNNFGEYFKDIFICNKYKERW